MSWVNETKAVRFILEVILFINKLCDNVCAELSRPNPLENFGSLPNLIIELLNYFFSKIRFFCVKTNVSRHVKVLFVKSISQVLILFELKTKKG